MYKKRAEFLKILGVLFFTRHEFLSFYTEQKKFYFVYAQNPTHPQSTEQPFHRLWISQTSTTSMEK